MPVPRGHDLHRDARVPVRFREVVTRKGAGQAQRLVARDRRDQEQDDDGDEREEDRPEGPRGARCGPCSERWPS